MTHNSLILPALKAADWPGAERAICRCLAPELDSPYSPWVAYGYDHPNTFEFITGDTFPSLADDQIALIEQAAIRNLRQQVVAWQLHETKISAFKTLRVLYCGDHFFAAERILDSEFMHEAQRLLKTDLLVVGIPRRGVMLASDGRQSQEMLSIFANLVSMQFHQAESAPITPMTFAVMNGRIAGLVRGGEEQGKQIVEEEAAHAPDETYISGMVSSDKVSGLETVHVLAGGAEPDKLNRAIRQTFLQVLREDVGREQFGGDIRIVIIPDITPDTPELHAAMAAIEEHLAGVVAELGDRLQAQRPINVHVHYGVPGELADYVDGTQLPRAGTNRSIVDADSKSTVARYVRQLHDADANVRRGAAEHLGQLGDARAIEPLIETLRDPLNVVHNASFHALKRFGVVAKQPVEAAFLKADPKTDQDYHQRLLALLSELQANTTGGVIKRFFRNFAGRKKA